MRFILHILFVALCALGLGLSGAYYITHVRVPFATLNLGAWQAYENIGKPDIDAFTLAYLSVSGEVPLAVVDGLAFNATRDDEGRLLDARCTYTVEGNFDKAALWTLAITDPQGNIPQNPSRREAFTVQDTMQKPDGSSAIAISHTPQSGNWLPAPEQGSFKLHLRFYDAAINAFNENSGRSVMPRITRGECS